MACARKLNSNLAQNSPALSAGFSLVFFKQMFGAKGTYFVLNLYGLF
jgi:hypothetical protein